MDSTEDSRHPHTVWFPLLVGLVLFAGCGGSDVPPPAHPVQYDLSGLTMQCPSTWRVGSKPIWTSKGPDVLQEVCFTRTGSNGPNFITILRMKDRAAAEKLFRSSQTSKSSEVPAEDSLGDLRWWMVASAIPFRGQATITVFHKHYVTHRDDAWFYVWIQTNQAIVDKTGEVIETALGEKSLRMVFDSIAYRDPAATPR